jgi:hypothetical protein
MHDKGVQVNCGHGQTSTGQQVASITDLQQQQQQQQDS